MKRFFAAAVIALSFFAPLSAFAAAYTGIDNFDTYTAGNSLNTDNGGSGWAGAWNDGSSGVATKVSTSVYWSSPNSVQILPSATHDATREMNGSGINSGDLYFALYYNSASSGSYGGITFQNDSGGTSPAGVVVRLCDTGSCIGRKLQYIDSTGTITLTTFTYQTWYFIHIHIVSSTTFQIEWKQNGGAWSGLSSTRTYANSISSPLYITIGSGDGGAVYVDSIQTTDPSPPAAVPWVFAPFTSWWTM